MKQKGFTLIEILVAFAIGTMLAGILFTSFFQSNQASQIIDNVIDSNITAATLIHQITKDVSGAFVPVSVQLLQEQREQEKKRAKDTPEASGKQGAEKTAAAKKGTGQSSEKKKQKLPKIEKIFYSSLKDNNLDVLTFITNNPLQPYWSPTAQGSVAKKPTVKLVRVVYRLVPEGTEKPLSYKLLRQESETLDFNKFALGGNIRAFEVANNIKTIKTEYSILIPEEKLDEQKPQDGAEKPKLQVKKMPTWNDGKLSGDQKAVSMTPHYAKITFVLWDAVKQAEFPFEAMIPIVPELPLREVKPLGKAQKPDTVPGKKDEKKLTAREKIDALLKKK